MQKNNVVYVWNEIASSIFVTCACSLAQLTINILSHSFEIHAPHTREHIAHIIHATHTLAPHNSHMHAHACVIESVFKLRTVLTTTAFAHGAKCFFFI